MAVMVSIYTGGEILTGPNGVYYSIGPVSVIPVISGTDLLVLKSIISQNLGLNQDRYDLDIQAKISMPTGSGQTWFQLFPVQNDGVWQVLYNQTISFSGGGYKIIELFVEINRVQRPNPLARLIRGAIRANASTSSSPVSQPPFQIDMPESSNAPVQEGRRSTSRPSRRSRIPLPIDMPESSQAPVQRDRPSNSQHSHRSRAQPCDPEEIEETVDPEIQEAEENWGDVDPDCMSDHSDTADTRPVLGQTKKFKVDKGFRIMGRGVEHPIAAFNDLSGFQEANVGLFGRHAEFENELSEGQTYDSKEEIKAAIYKFHILCNKEIKNTHSDKQRIRFKCKDPRCGWYINARVTGFGTQWKVSKCPTKHVCHADATRIDHAQLTAAMVADCISAHMRNDVDLSITSVRIACAQTYNGQVPAYNKLWRGRELAIARQFGSWEGSYALIVPLLEAIKRKNPGTLFDVTSYPTGEPGPYRYFNRAAWAFGPCIEAFQHLRPVITVDACFLAGRYKGKMLIATGYDAENQLLPLAFSLVDTENFEDCAWFMQWLRRNVIRSRFVCVITDRGKGIKKVFRQDDLGWNEEDEDECVHRLCATHIAENMKKNHCNEEAIKYFRICVAKRKMRRYEQGMQAMGDVCDRALNWLDGVGKYLDQDDNECPKPWKIFQALDGGFRWGIMTTNGSESLNNVFRSSRRLPVAAIIEDTFYKCQQWFAQRRAKAQFEASQGQQFSCRVHELINKRCGRSQSMTTLGGFGNWNEFEITSTQEKVNAYMKDASGRFTKANYKYTVVIMDENTVTCTCQKPQLNRIPCSHVLAVCRLRGIDPGRFVHYYYHIQTLINTWLGEWHVYDNQSDWPESEGPILVPNDKNITLGRRRVNRIPMWLDLLHNRRRGHQTRRDTQEQQNRAARDARG